MNLARLRCMQYCVVACDRVVVCITLSVYLVIVRIIAYFLVNNHLYEYATAHVIIDILCHYNHYPGQFHIIFVAIIDQSFS